MITFLIGLAMGLLAGFAISRLRYGEALTHVQTFNNRLQLTLGEQRDVNLALLDALARQRGVVPVSQGLDGKAADEALQDAPAFDKVTYAPGTLQRFPDLEGGDKNGKA